MLAELVEVVIGVDTHKHTHTAAVVAAATGAVLAQATVSADPTGYAELVELAAGHPGIRAWAMEGSGGYGAGLAAHLARRSELVVELDRPARPARKAGAKSDPIDAVRAARDALARTQLAQPRTGGQRAALQVLLTARRAAVTPRSRDRISCTPWSSPPPRPSGPASVVSRPARSSRPRCGFAPRTTPPRSRCSPR